MGSTSGAFRVADAVAAGVGENRLRSRDLDVPHRGVRVVAGTDDDDPFARMRRYAPLLRAGDRFSVTTAAALWGAPLPDGLELPIHDWPA